MKNSAEELVSIQAAKFGQGIFAKENLAKGTVILKIEGPYLNFTETLETNEESYCLQIGIDQYIIPEGSFRYSNHSCDPNAGINFKFELVALREIPAGEEICWDYSTSMLERHWTMECRCGSPTCRQLITDFDLLPRHVQQFYRRRGIVLPFIEEYVSRLSHPRALASDK